MKLNLLPTSVSRGRRVKGAIFVSLIIAVASMGASAYMVTSSRAALERVKGQAQEVRVLVDEDVAISAQADTIMADPQVENFVRQVNLARSMEKHNTAYTQFYRRLFQYIPSFYRINNLSVTPADGGRVTVNMTGVIKDQYQYADLMLALLRIPGASGVTRSGFTIENPTITRITEDQPDARLIIPGEPIPPDDPLERVNFYINQGNVTHFEGAGNFGSGDRTTPRGAMPGNSVVNVSLSMPGNLFTPNPRSTLANTKRAAPPAAAPAGGAATTGAPALPPGAPGGGG